MIGWLVWQGGCAFVRVGVYMCTYCFAYVMVYLKLSFHIFCCFMGGSILVVWLMWLMRWRDIVRHVCLMHVFDEFIIG